MTDNTTYGERAYPFARLLGMELVDWTAEHAVIRQPIRPEITNRQGIPHGGLYASLLDTAMGYAGCFTGDADDRRFAVTLTLTTSFLARPQGEVLLCKGWRTGGGKSTFFAEARVEDEAGTLVATGSGAFRYMRAPA